MEEALVRDHVALIYETFGDCGDQPVLLVPGAGAPKEFWHDSFCQRLASCGFFVIRFSHRDTDFSTHFDEDYPISEIVQDMLALITKLTNRPCHLIGHSMGGFIVQLAALAMPEKFKSVTSVSSGSVIDPALKVKYGLSDMEPAVWERLLQNQPVGRFQTDWPGWLDSWKVLNGSLTVDETLAMAYTKELYKGDERNAMPALKHINCLNTVPADLPYRLKNLQVPLLAIHGAEDLLIPIDNGAFTASTAGNGAFFALEKAGHMFFNLKTWDQIGTRILEHIK